MIPIIKRESVAAVILMLVAMATQGCMEGADFVPENVELRFDWSSFASEIFYEAQDHEVFYGNLEIRAPFKTALESTFFSKSTSESYRTEEGYHTYYGFTPRWIPAVRVESQLRSYSRERIFYVTSLNPVMIGNIGLFRYPIAVRQRGTYGTYYLDEAQIASCIEDPGRWRDTTLIPVGEDQRFVRGRVELFGTLQRAMTAVGGSPLSGIAYTSPQPLQTKEVIISIGSLRMVLSAQYDAFYELFGKYDPSEELSVGDSVEINIPTVGVGHIPGVFLVYPQSIRAIKE